MSSWLAHVPSYLSWATAPRILWDAYVKYLWNYEPGSSVGRTASTFRVLAVAVVFPVVILILLDVTSYVIARTLGIVDDVKASTSDATDNVTMSPSMPTILVQSSPAPDAERNSASPDAAENANDQRRITSRRDHAHGDQRDVQGQEVCDDHEGHNRAGGPGGETRPQAFFAGEEDLQLAGVGVFSPAVSQPPSPELPRVKLNTWEGGVFSVNEAEERTADTVSLRRRVQQPQEQLE